jgi:DNA-binding NarL/FixJ family response regulator
MKNYDIAKTTGVTTNTIKNHIRAIFDKTGTWSRLELALWYLKANESKSVNTSVA